MAKRYKSELKNTYEMVINYRGYCEKRAMKVLAWLHQLKPIHPDKEVQKQRNIFLYKYYEHQYNLCEKFLSSHT